jgi:hypothetical protein
LSGLYNVKLNTIGYLNKAALFRISVENRCRLTYLISRLLVRSGFLDTHPGRAHAERKFHSLLQLRVFGFGLFEDGYVGVGVFPGREEVFVGGERPNAGGVCVGTLC